MNRLYVTVLVVAGSFAWNAVAEDIPMNAPGVVTTAIRPGDPLLPDGYRIAAWLDCGVEQETDENDAPRITLLNGESHVFSGISGPMGTAAFDAKQVVYEITGLDPHADYVLGFSWWDADDRGRVQSVAFSAGDGGEAWAMALPPVRASAFNADASTWARVLLPLAAPYDLCETLRVAFVAEAGPNAVINELWLLKRTATDARKRVLIVTGDDYTGHDWRATAPALAEVLREDSRIEVSINESPAIYGSPLLDHYDATVLHFKNYEDRLPLGPAVQDGLRRHVAAGNGLVISHFGCGAFEEWEGFVKIAGRVWNPELRGHDPHGVFTVRIADATHPVTLGMDDFETLDELYTCLDGDTPIQILCDAVSVVDERTYPMAFVVEGTGGRVFHCVLGHDTRAYAARGVRSLFQRGTAWATGLTP